MADEKKNVDGSPIVPTDDVNKVVVPPVTEIKDEDLQKDLKIDEGKTYTADEVKKIAIENLRKGANISKNQLNNDLTSMRTKLTEINSAKEQLERKLADSTTGSKEADTLKQQLADKESELSLTKGKLDVMENEGTKAIVQVEQLRTEINNERLVNHKLKIIADAKNEIVAEMITGNTIEELNASAVSAKQKYSDIQKELRIKLNVPLEEKQQEEEKPIVIPSLNFAKPDVKDWAKKRDEITLSIYEKHGFPVGKNIR